MYGDHMLCEQTRSSLADVTLDSTFGLNPDHDKIERELPPSRALSASVARDLLLVASRNAGACCANAVRENPRSVSIHVDVDLSPCDCVVCVVDLSMYYSLCPDRDHLTLSLFLSFRCV